MEPFIHGHHHSGLPLWPPCWEHISGPKNPIFQREYVPTLVSFDHTTKAAFWHCKTPKRTDFTKTFVQKFTQTSLSVALFDVTLLLHRIMNIYGLKHTFLINTNFLNFISFRYRIFKNYVFEKLKNKLGQTVTFSYRPLVMTPKLLHLTGPFINWIKWYIKWQNKIKWPANLARKQLQYMQVLKSLK